MLHEARLGDGYPHPGPLPRLIIRHIFPGTSGNLSQRVEDGFLLTPTGMDYDALVPEDLVLMRFDGSHEGRRAPSSEWRFHRDLLARRPESGSSNCSA
ncbi:hypothetical protein Q664_12200 [Archangium violaceum Cb vi76]|uniref:Class II aldolase/adducin N-terminal domain-containing protein n=1 Tax=Archangium violaceum Cb vi76 TaxID=1406225 RepID=A0A084SX47_9BACT|nr:hypothetical protein Q664_12200 [Archangium violaceum Cb vi76]